jgi:hypothetical protein
MDRIKTIKYTGPLFRANKNIYNKKNKTKIIYKANKAKSGNLASNNYKNAPTKYFTLKRKNVNAYTKEGTTYTKNWNVVKVLDLVDILDLNTREAIEEKFKNDTVFVNAITDAFPIIDGIVRRISSSSEQDNEIIYKICKLGYDGYYMDVEGKNIGFHSEIGICNKAFKKLKLMKNSERKYVPNNVTKKTKSRFTMNINNNNNGTLRQPQFTMNNNNNGTLRRPRFSMNINNNTTKKNLSGFKPMALSFLN